MSGLCDWAVKLLDVIAATCAQESLNTCCACECGIVLFPHPAFPSWTHIDVGEPGDRVQFSELIIANVKLYALRNEMTLSTKAVANFTRSYLAEALRKVNHSVIGPTANPMELAEPAH